MGEPQQSRDPERGGSEPPDPRYEKGRALREAGPYLTISGNLIGPILGGVLVGRWLDGKYGPEPYWTLGCALFGIVAGFYHFLKIVLKDLRPPSDKS